MAKKPRRRSKPLVPKRRRARPGAEPGTLRPAPDALASHVSCTAYGRDGLEERPLTDVSEIAGLMKRWPVVWIDVHGLADTDRIRGLGRQLDLHPLALEDVVNQHQRPKVEDYDDYLFIVLRSLRARQQVEDEQLSIFLGKGFVLTFQERPSDRWEPVRKRIRRHRGGIRAAGADYLAYALIDAAVDEYFPVLERYGEALEALEDEVIARPERTTMHRIHEIRRELLAARRAVWPLREAVNVVIRDTGELVRPDTAIYLRDTYDHCVQIMDIVETFREVSSSLTDIYLSALSNQANDVMKVLALIATIFIPMTFIAGVYGMNFDPELSPWNMPELRWAYGYPFALALMAGTGLVMILYFRRKGWFGAAKHTRSSPSEKPKPWNDRGEDTGPSPDRPL